MLKYGKSLDTQRLHAARVAIDAAQVDVDTEKVVACNVVAVGECRRIENAKTIDIKEF